MFSVVQRFHLLVDIEAVSLQEKQANV